MPPTVDDRLHDILFSICRIQAITQRQTFGDFASDELARMATERYLEIVCEASRHIPEIFKHEAHHIDWRQIIDFGNRLRHAYRQTDVSIVWGIVSNHLPSLKAFAESKLQSPES